MLIRCQAHPSAPPPPPSPPFACHKNRWSSAQLVVPASRQGLMVMSPSSAQKKQKIVNSFSVPCLSPTPHPIYFWKHTGADWAMISWKESCFPLNITSPHLICISQGKVKHLNIEESVCLCSAFSLRLTLTWRSYVHLKNKETFRFRKVWEMILLPLVHIDEKDNIWWLVSQLKLKWVSRALTQLL